jgi:hypothetical protein
VIKLDLVFERVVAYFCNSRSRLSCQLIARKEMDGMTFVVPTKKA